MARKKNKKPRNHPAKDARQEQARKVVEARELRKVFEHMLNEKDEKGK